jgi:hypothetical protein
MVYCRDCVYFSETEEHMVRCKKSGVSCLMTRSHQGRCGKLGVCYKAKPRINKKWLLALVLCIMANIFLLVVIYKQGLLITSLEERCRNYMEMLFNGKVNGRVLVYK